MQDPQILCSVADGIAHIQFNRPAKKNALVDEMWTQLSGILETVELDPSVRVIVFSGAEGNFTAGYDLGDFLHRPPISSDSAVFRFLALLSQVQKPLIAAVEGVAIGIGTTLLLHCDFAYAASNACFQMPFVNLGLCPEAASSLLVPRLCGQRKAAELLLLANKFDTATALSCGFINAQTEPGQALAIAMATARSLTQKPPAALRLSKALMRRAEKQLVTESIAEEAACFSRLLLAAEAKEAFSAFLEKRAPDFSRF